MRIKLNYPSGREITRDMVPNIIKNVEHALQLIAEDAGGLFAEATPVGVMGAAQGGWEKNVTVTANPVKAVAVVENAQPYVYFIVNGTAPAKWNPGKHIVSWVEKKLPVPTQYRIARSGGMSEKRARRAVQDGSLAVSVAFMIGRKRQLRGSKPNDFMSPVISSNEARWEQIIVRAVDRALNSNF